jgi:hypothetical protein
MAGRPTKLAPVCTNGWYKTVTGELREAPDSKKASTKPLGRKAAGRSVRPRIFDSSASPTDVPDSPLLTSAHQCSPVLASAHQCSPVLASSLAGAVPQQPFHSVPPSPSQLLHCLDAECPIEKLHAETQREEVWKSHNEGRKFQESWQHDGLENFEPELVEVYDKAMKITNFVTKVRCTVCAPYRKNLVLENKKDTLQKHNLSKKHDKYARMVDSRILIEHDAEGEAALLKAAMDEGKKKEMAQKKMQLRSLLHVLERGQSMLDYEALYPLYQELGIKDLPSAHWCDNSGWQLLDALDEVVLKKLLEEIIKVRLIYIFLLCFLPLALLHCCALY